MNANKCTQLWGTCPCGHDPHGRMPVHTTPKKTTSSTVNTSPVDEEQDENKPQRIRVARRNVGGKFVQARADAEYVSIVEQSVTRRHTIHDAGHHGPAGK